MMKLELIVIISLFASVVKSNLPRSIRACPKNVPNISECVKHSIESLRPFMRTGDYGDGLRGEGIDPLKLDDIHLRRPGLTGDVTNVIAIGASNFDIEKIKFDFDKSSLDALINIPRIQVAGNYANQFNFGWLKAQAKGRMSAVVGNLKVRLTFRGKHETRNGQRYIKIDSLVAIPKITKINIHLENAFKDKALNDAVNVFLNQNVDLFVPDVEKSVKTTMQRLFKSTAQKVFDNYPLSVLNP